MMGTEAASGVWLLHGGQVMGLWGTPRLPSPWLNGCWGRCRLVFGTYQICELIFLQMHEEVPNRIPALTLQLSCLLAASQRAGSGGQPVPEYVREAGREGEWRADVTSETGGNWVKEAWVAHVCTPWRLHESKG